MTYKLKHLSPIEIRRIADLARAMLEDGPKSATECEAKLKAANIRTTTAKKAKRELGVKSEKKGSVWFWRLLP